MGCSDGGEPNDPAGSGGVAGASNPATGGATGGSPSGAGTTGTSTAGTLSAGGSGSGAGGASAGSPSLGGTSSGGSGGGSGGTAGSATGGTAAGTGGASSGAGGMAGMAPSGGTGGALAGAGSGGTGGGTAGGGATADDIDMKPENFTCIADWEKVLGFRITNLLGHLEEAIAVAKAGTGTYPVGTVIQHLPTEAMVKRRAGFSPETKDWEFFLLQLGPQGQVTIQERGTTQIKTAMGQTCVSCHSKAPDEFDFVCNTWGEKGSENCGFDFNDSFLNMQLSMDTRCN